MFKSGFVAIIGRTNVGKSTAINMLTGEKVAITVNKSQTTRTAIRAIVNRPSSQIIFMDTPGIHKPKTKLGETMLETALGSITEVDIVLYIIDASREGIGKGDELILEKIRASKKKTILLINKMDLISKEKLAEVISLYQKEYNFEAVIPIVANSSKNAEKNRNLILEEIEKHLKEGPAYYDIEEYTDQTQRQLVEEVIREKALRLLEEEVPHGIYIEVEKMQERTTAKGEEIYDVEAVIYCLRNSHKGIIIGKNGAMLKRIGTYAREDLERMLQTKLNLKLWVKVREDWQDSDNIVKKFKFN